jgi:DNA-binding NtrC family response regulator
VNGLSLLLVNGDSSLVKVLSRVLEDSDYRVLATEGPFPWESLLAHEDHSSRQKAVTANGDGFRVLQELIGQNACARLILVEVVRETAVDSIKELARRVTVRPTNGNGASPMSNEPSEILGASSFMRNVRKQVLTAAESELPVLITGETGTGKDLVARTIHRLSLRKGRPLIAHSCAVTPLGLFESCFFGHRRGAFTGASERSRGLLEEADGSHLFLDELETMPLEHQAKLLRVMEDGQVRPLGSAHSFKVSVRYLAATNCDPQRMMTQGTLRVDLYYRLRKIQIHLKPLRERREDIPVLIEHFLGPQASMLTAEAKGRLIAEEWPGNVRQLQSVLLSARDSVLASRDDRIAIEHLDLTPTAFECLATSTAPRYFVHGTKLAEVEREVILEALQESGGNQSAAARALGIQRRTLWAKLRRHAIEVQRGPLENDAGTQVRRIDAPSASKRHTAHKQNGAE